MIGAQISGAIGDFQCLNLPYKFLPVFFILPLFKLGNNVDHTKVDILLDNDKASLYQTFTLCGGNCV